MAAPKSGLLPLPELTPTPDPKVLAKKIRSITRGLNDWRPVWHLLVPHMLKMASLHFRTGGSSTGSAWPPTKKPGKATLVLSGAFVHSMTSKSNAVRYLDRKAVGIAPNVGRYPFMHHFGAERAGRRGRGGYPARPWMVWTEAGDR